jgi:hypothetical protein
MKHKEMTLNEWDKYVQDFAKTIPTPSCDQPIVRIDGSFQWKSWQKERPVTKYKPVIKKKPDALISVKSGYETRTYFYNGRYYERKWVK